MKTTFRFLTLLAAVAFATNDATAAKKAAPLAPLSESGNQLQTQYAEMLKALQADLSRELPTVSESKKADFAKARAAADAAEKQAEAAQQTLGKVQGAKALVEHAKGKWIGGADKGIAQAKADLAKATTDAERAAANKELAKWQANREEGVKALKERQAALDQASVEGPKLTAALEAAKKTLAAAKAAELAAFQSLLADLAPALASDQMDAKLVKGVVLAHATPRGLAEFAEQGQEQAALVTKLLADSAMMKTMLEAGGVDFGKYGQAMQIYTAIQKASPKAKDGMFQRLALATSLEFATPVNQSNAKDQANAPAFVDPVKRYLHYEKAYLDGELDPAFKTLNTWEYRMVVECDAPDEILAWGRAALRNFRPDHISNPNYGWRYSSAVKTEVPYGSQNVKYDLPSLHHYQNIPKNGGVCGRRAFFGRFILRAFGIPVWGVTQHAHAALSHWTPQGWVVNLGAGFHASWWDKDEESRSGSDFLLESQAREHEQEYLKVLRAQWISRILGEPAYNDRKKVAGGFWSSTAHFQALVLASQAVTLGPLGQELGEANEAIEKQVGDTATVKAADQQVSVSAAGAITIPSVAHGKSTGPKSAMKSYAGGMQINCIGGFKTQYAFDAPRAGKYQLTARVATLQEGQKFLFAANDASTPVEVAVPYTIGMWQPTQPIEVTLKAGANVLNFELATGSRSVTIKEFTLKSVN